MRRCAHCRSTLDATGRCPGTLPLLDPRRDGRLYGTAAQLAHHFGADVTTDMVHNWRKRDGLERYRDGRDVYSPVDQTSSIERGKRLSKEETGRGRPRRLDVPLATMSDVDDLATWLRARPELDPADRKAILSAPAEVADPTTDRYSGKTRPYHPGDYLWTPAEVYAAHPDQCRECYSARPYPDGQRHFGWALWRDCDAHACQHAHHDDEVWLA